MRLKYDCSYVFVRVTNYDWCWPGIRVFELVRFLENYVEIVFSLRVMWKTSIFEKWNKNREVTRCLKWNFWWPTINGLRNRILLIRWLKWGTHHNNYMKLQMCAFEQYWKYFQYENMKTPTKKNCIFARRLVWWKYSVIYFWKELLPRQKINNIEFGKNTSYFI